LGGAYSFRADLAGPRRDAVVVLVIAAPMPNPDDPNEEAMRRLDRKLTAFEAERARKGAPAGDFATAKGYRFLGEVIGGVLGGLGLGWLFDYFAHTLPLGLISGMLIGTGFSIFIAVRGAVRMSRDAEKAAGPLPSVPDDDDDE
jgi:ATP synthase protein I